MAASDYFQKVGRGTATTLSAPGYTIGNTSINVGSTANWGDETGVTFAIDEVDSDGVRVEGTYNVFRGVVSSATQVSDLTYVGGDPNRDYTAGATTRVYVTVSSYRENRVVDGLLVSHDQDGTLKAGAVDVAAVLASDVVETAKIKDLNVTTAKIADGAVTPAKWANPYKFSAYLSSNTAIASATQKIALGSELFDTNSDFDSTTNYRYTAPVDGFYQIDAQAGIATSGMGTNESAALALYKNGSLLLRSEQVNGSGDAFRLPRPRLSGLIQLSASDYLELYVIMGGVYRDITGGSSITYFTGYLVSRT